MIIIEGTDLTGKTTLAKQLVRKYDATYVHLGLPVPPQRHWDKLCWTMNSHSRLTVYDRAGFGSVVYGSIMDDEPNRYPVTLDELNRFVIYLEDSRSVVIHADTPVWMIEERFNKIGDKYVPIGAIRAARTMYREVFRKVTSNHPKLSVIEYDSSRTTPQQFIDTWGIELSDALYPLSAPKGTLR